MTANAYSLLPCVFSMSYEIKPNTSLSPCQGFLPSTLFSLPVFISEALYSYTKQKNPPGSSMKKKHLLAAGGIFTAAAAAACLLLFTPCVSIDSTERLNELTDRFFRQEVCASTLNLHYTLADPKSRGIDDYPVRLGSLSPESVEEDRLLTENFRAALLDIDRSCLSAKDQFTYDVLDYTLETALEGYTWYYYQEPLSPSLGIQAQLPILLAEYAFYSEQDVTDYLTLLSQTGDYFRSILAFEQEKAARSLFMSDETADAIISQCIYFINDSGHSYLEELFREKLDSLPGLSAKTRKACERAHQELLKTCMIPAYQELVNGLTALKGSRSKSQGLCSLPNGEAYYSYLVRASTGSDRTVEAISQLLNETRTGYALAIQEMISEQPSLLASMDISIDARDPETILNSLKNQIQNDFPDLPDTSVAVKQVHSSLEEYSSPAFYLTPPIDRVRDNVIYINASDGYQGIDLFTTLAHEGYPGHLYQTVYSYSSCSNPLQSILNIGGYTEGWATYAELYSYSLCGLEPSVAELLSINKAWTLNLYSTMDLGIHYYGWNIMDVYEFLCGYGIENLDTAREIYQAIVEDPANYLKYYVGYLEFDALRQRAEKALGTSFDLKEFHQVLLTLGPAPFSLLEKELDRFIAQKD